MKSSAYTIVLRAFLLPLLAALGLAVGALSIGLFSSEGVRGYGGPASILSTVVGFLTVLVAPTCIGLAGRPSRAALVSGLVGMLVSLWLSSSIVSEVRLGNYERWIQYLYVREQDVSKAVRATSWTSFGIAVLCSAACVLGASASSSCRIAGARDPEKTAPAADDAYGRVPSEHSAAGH